MQGVTMEQMMNSLQDDGTGLGMNQVAEPAEGFGEMGDEDDENQ